ncbi:kinase-like protein [Aureobasidium namibiae CBS 147.97]|uniref:non-specific serine/threonine protein kinase n=1 Tax=Aureobasidium namibiae CBS 147.97 TaxID=1043004 RepID=A0A074WDP1_9PEZI
MIAVRLDPLTPIEEETLLGYKAERFLPIRTGQVFNDRYETIGKLGYGSASTVWFCRDLLTTNKYAALKVYVHSSKKHRELAIYEHIKALSSDHHGRHRIRSLLDSFEIQGPHGRHICLVHEPLGISFEELRDLTADRVFDEDLIRQTFRPILQGFEFLHEEAQVIHTDFQPNNVLVGIHDGSVLDQFAAMANKNPPPKKELPDRIIYASQPMPLTKGLPFLTDFSEARFGSSMHTGIIMPNVYRAPEVILGMEWSYPVDIWSFAMTLWDLFQPERLFTAKSCDGQYSESHHLAQMVAVLGNPPPEFLAASKQSSKYWDQSGNWIHEVAIPAISLESCERRLSDENKKNFLTFIRKMLRWKPEDRSGWHDIFFDEWLLADLIESGEIVRDD